MPDLTARVPAQVRQRIDDAVATLEVFGPPVIDALRTLGAVSRQAFASADPVGSLDDAGCAALERQLGLDRAWRAAGILLDVDPDR